MQLAINRPWPAAGIACAKKFLGVGVWNQAGTPIVSWHPWLIWSGGFKSWGCSFRQSRAYFFEEQVLVNHAIQGSNIFWNPDYTSMPSYPNTELCPLIIAFWLVDPHIFASRVEKGLVLVWECKGLPQWVETSLSICKEIIHVCQLDSMGEVLLETVGSKITTQTFTQQTSERGNPHWLG